MAETGNPQERTNPKADSPTPEAYGHAAWMLMAEPSAVRAVAEVETGPHGAFLPSGEPVILFERHLFHRLTAGRHDLSHPHLSSEVPGGYGTVAEQHPKLAAASALNRSAALRACSWGAFQILGLNHVQAGFPELQHFVNAMYRSVDDHLRAFVMFIRSDTRLLEALQAKDWRAFAYAYNGPAYAKHHYDERMAAAYRRLAEAA